MAEAIYNHLTNSRDAFSAGTYVGVPDEPEGQFLSDLFKNEPVFFKVMEEHGIDLRNNRTKKLLPEMLNQFDIVVSMAEESYIPEFLKNDKRVIWWNIENSGSTLKEMCDKYNKIEELVRELIKNTILKFNSARF